MPRAFLISAWSFVPWVRGPAAITLLPLRPLSRFLWPLKGLFERQLQQFPRFLVSLSSIAGGFWSIWCGQWSKIIPGHINAREAPQSTSSQRHSAAPSHQLHVCLCVTLSRLRGHLCALWSPPRLPGSIAHARDVFYMKHCGVMERLVTDTPIFQTGKLRIRGKVSHSRSDSRPGQDFKLDTIDSRPHAVFTPPACSV